MPEAKIQKNLRKKKKSTSSSQEEIDQEQIERWENEGGAIVDENNKKNY